MRTLVARGDRPSLTLLFFSGSPQQRLLFKASTVGITANDPGSDAPGQDRAKISELFVEA